MTTTDPNGPADTRLMGIIHEALRRDLRRTRTVLTAAPAPGPGQRRTLAAHLAWIVDFLEAHHRTEDEGLYPLVRRRDPAAGALIDRMAADHQAVATDLAIFEAVAAAYGTADGDGERDALLSALDALEASLLPHLRREEDEMMPLVSTALTDAELRRWDDEANIKPKSLRQLGREGHWIIDGLGPEERDLVLHLVPPVSRFVLLHGFARGYRRHLADCWGIGSSKRRVQKQGRTEVVVPADREAIWEVVRDVTRVGEWSHECVGGRWLGGATEAAVGARFRGRNRNGLFRWGRICEVLDATPYELVWRTVPTLLFPDSTEWRIALHEAEGGTRIEQRFRVLRAPKVLDLLYATVVPAHRDRSDALRADLARLGEVAGTRAAALQAQPPA